MATHTFVRPAHIEVPRPELHLAGWLTIGLLALLGVGAFAGGAALVAKPDGSIMGFEVSILAGSPFSDFVVPGLILGGLFGVGSLLVGILGLRHVRIAPFLAFAIGCGQMIWIVVQLAIIGTSRLSFLHPMFFGVGLAIALAAVPWGWPTFDVWRRNR